MNKILITCLFVLCAVSASFAQSNTTESLTISAYYPSPLGVYRTLKFIPTDITPSGSFLSPGVIYYNNTLDKIVYFNKTLQPINLTSGGSGGGNETYWNQTSSHHIYNTNQGKVGIGTSTPYRPLYVRYSSSDKNNPVVFRLIKKLLNTGGEQWFSFYLYPRNAAPAAYLDSTTVAYASLNPPRVLELAAGDQDQHIRFSVGNITEFNGEVMRLVHRNGEHLTTAAPDGRVGIGTTDPLMTLEVDSKKEMASPLFLRGITAGLTTGKFTITPYADSVYLSYGCYLDNTSWMHDPYHFIEWPSGIERTSYEGAKINIQPNQGVKWSCYDSGGIGAGNRITSWNVAFGVLLWDRQGIWRSGCAPTSSRKMKEDFQSIDQDELLARIDQLEISRWNYKKDGNKVSHIGPVAEDFNRIFKTGKEEDRLNIVDSVGVSLAGVKALSGKITGQQAKIEELKRQVKNLKSRLNN